MSLFVYFLQKATLTRLSSKLGPEFNVSDEKMVSDNLVEFELYFDELSYKLLDERPAYPVRKTMHAMFHVVT